MMTITVTSADYRDIANKLKPLNLNHWRLSPLFQPSDPTNPPPVGQRNSDLPQQDPAEAALNKFRNIVFFEILAKRRLWDKTENEEHGTISYLSHLNIYNEVYERTDTTKCPYLYIMKYGHIRRRNS